MIEDILPIPPLEDAVSALSASSGFELKDQWIGKVLNEVRRGNEVMEQQQGESSPLRVQV